MCLIPKTDSAGRKFALRFILGRPINLTRPNFSNLACLFDLTPLNLNLYTHFDN